MTIKIQQQNLNQAITRTAQEEVYAIARKVLNDLAGTTLEENMVQVFLHRLQKLNDIEMADLKSAFKASESPLLVRTAFPLPNKEHAEIEKVIKEILGKEKKVQFAIVPDLVSGIEISSNGEKIAWSISDYLVSLGKSVDSLLQTKNKIDVKDRPDIGQKHDENRA
jgi:F-type H+-transporting ATPase subunit b